MISPEYSNQFLHWRVEFLVTDHVTGGEVTKVPAACYQVVSFVTYKCQLITFL